MISSIIKLHHCRLIRLFVMNELLDTLANMFIWWPAGNNKKRRQGKDLKGLPLRKIPDLSPKKEQPEGKQAR
ncbi:hypothetical protein BN440_4061 [Erwinia amylovora MR1]|nr:hypothetical protein BN440_4061 [Erwinia amylovora MR1]